MARKKQETTRRSTVVKTKPVAKTSSSNNQAPRSGASTDVSTAKSPGGTKDVPARESMIRERAYYLAEQRGFVPGYEERDWLAAERDIDARQASH